MPSATNMDAGVEVVRRTHYCRQYKANRAQLKLLFSSLIILLQTIRCEERDRASEHDETQKTEHDIQSFGNCAAFRDCTKRDKGIRRPSTTSSRLATAPPFGIAPNAIRAFRKVAHVAAISRTSFATFLAVLLPVVISVEPLLKSTSRHLYIK
jgi:hypothetical protein